MFFYPKSVTRIRSVLLLYIERIFIRFFAGTVDYVKKKYDKKTPIETKRLAESINAQN